MAKGIGRDLYDNTSEYPNQTPQGRTAMQTLFHRNHGLLYSHLIIFMSLYLIKIFFITIQIHQLIENNIENNKKKKKIVESNSHVQEDGTVTYEKSQLICPTYDG